MKKDVILDSDTAKSIDSKKFSGSIVLKFSKYKVNQGIERSFFVDEEPE
jgi:hypothetical protein